MFRSEAKAKIAGELARGWAARQQGFEGRARVCARRAAGQAVREYLELRGMEIPGPSAVDLLTYLQNQADVSSEIRDTAMRLLTRVNESFTLPVEADLLEDARWLAHELEESSSTN